MKSARRWRGLVCPDCRFVFRVPKNHDGTGVVCPSCRRLLRIPGPYDASPPLVVALDEKTEPDVAKGEWRRRKRKKSTEDDMAWEEESGQVSSARPRAQRMGGLLMVVVILLTGLVVWLSYTMSHQTEPVELVRSIPDVTEVVVPEVPAAPKLWFDEESVKKLCRAFVAASSVEELLPMIRNAEQLEPVLRRHYPEGKVDGVELINMVIARDIPFGDSKALMLHIQTKNDLRRFLAICETPDGLKVDWESWVGLSTMPWPEMMEKRPTDPVLVRVLFSGVDYYNMDFSNDAEWRSCRMLSPDGENLLYGYLRVGTDEELALIRMVIADVSGDNRVTLMVRYPANARSPNQVIIDRIVAKDWLIPDTKP